MPVFLKQACQKGDGAACTQAANYLMETKQRYEAGVEGGLAKALGYKGQVIIITL